MGVISKAIFGRSELPERCMIYGGAYLPRKKEVVRKLFDNWGKTKGNWIKYTYAKTLERKY